MGSETSPSQRGTLLTKISIPSAGYTGYTNLYKYKFADY